MAQSTSQILPTVSRAGPTTTRSNSIVSTASSNSGASLRRRSRTRTRTLTSSRRGKSQGPADDAVEDGPLSALEDAPPLPPLLISDHEDDAVSSSGESLVFSPPLPRRLKPSSSSRRQELLTDRPPEGVFKGRERAHSSASARDVFVDTTINRGRQARSESGSIRAVKAAKRGSSLPRHAFRNIVSSPSSPVPLPLTPANLLNNSIPRRVHERRDSLASYGSSTSSSLYPQSTSTASHPESSIGPHSIRDEDDASSFSPRIVTFSEKDAEFDVDDVSYRLRLLVNNSYFLPPAHSKPTPLSLAPPPVQPGQKNVKPASSPGLLGFFGLGKSKSKPNSPAGQNPPNLDLPPVLRTTSDSVGASGHVPRPQPRSVPQTPMHPPFAAAHANPVNRVVVLREKMDDLATAAKQAEKDIKIKAEVRKATNHSAPPDLGYVDDVIDPTDAVDLPMPSDTYPFAVQTSAMHGLGIQESVGADVLADRLPPSPGMWSMSSEEDSWRKALLHQAVSHSLVNTPEKSFSSSGTPHHHPSPSSANSSSFRNSFPGHSVASEENATDSTPKARIGQRIMEPEQIVEEIDATGSSPVASTFPPPSSRSVKGISPTTEVPPSSPWGRTVPLVSELRRAETPATARALAPPPRRLMPPHSLSQTDLPGTISKDPNDLSSEASRVLRRAVSSPRLSAMPELDMLPLSLSPPPTNSRRISPASSTSQLRSFGSVPTFSSSGHTRRSETNTSHYSDDSLSYATAGDIDDEADHRPSMSISLHTDARSSIYSHPSPTASAFQDAVFGSYRTSSPLNRRSHHSIESSCDVDDLPARTATLSPPPRVSSSLGPTILPPPPRSPATKPVYRPSSSLTSFQSMHSSHSSTPLSSIGLQEEPEEHERQPHLDTTPTPSPTSSTSLREPMTYSQPLAERRGVPPSLSLRIPTENVSPVIHSAPAPASPTAFFDRIQSHPNAMDDLETSDESEDEDTAGGKSNDSPPGDEAPRPLFTEPRMRALSGGAVPDSGPRPPITIMRLGNHSTPHLSPSPGQHEVPVFDIQDRSPVGNTPEIPFNTFFASRKKAGGDFPLTLADAQGSKVSLALSTTSHASNGGSSPLRVTSAAGSSIAPSAIPRPSTAGASLPRPRAFQRESLQRFDGMLLQHMMTEKDTIKRITTNISGSRS
ncbi:hypothetical protein BXZ70DRAFT_973392 [Cristinia sonorae]|uniref:Uncharacterized protein n=1 Tax=Cristinia sonorae TaxID=1940300 RepID=A0A8K0UPV3_9AGAR|nr:hypothetical protein BXZ70DRAFT_973392 [Cristinia sonorae]